MLLWRDSVWILKQTFPRSTRLATSHKDLSYEPKHYHRRALVELPYHLVKGEMYHKYNSVFFDFSFLQEKIKAGMVYELVDDFKLAIEEGKNKRLDKATLDKLMDIFKLLNQHVSS